MRCDIQCVKDIILFAQDNASSYDTLSLKQYISALPQYNQQVIVEHLRYLEDAELFHRVVIDDLGLVGKTTGLTVTGQRFAEAIRDDTLWNKVVSAGKQFLPDIIKFILTL